ncbi:MAG: hypothetical protein A4E72_02080 [Syntrophus sp. PtaU1.Bin208]|nr:MAG: hypothetical protein A4E72_02080 [Syntrophus sp. PtaU1.Bin208]
MEEEKQEKSFVVKDKRMFSESGEQRQPEPQKPEAPPTASEEPKAKPSETKAEEEHHLLPEVNFFNFVLSLSTTVMFHFGDFPDPVTHETQKNLPAAKQTIDILSMLKDKTKGNLDDHEKSLLDEILFELKMRYVKETS